MRESRQDNIFIAIFKLILKKHKKYMKNIKKESAINLTDLHEKDIIEKLEDKNILQKNKSHRLTYNIRLIYSILKSYDVKKKYYKKYNLDKNKPEDNYIFFTENLKLIDVKDDLTSKCECSHSIRTKYIFENKKTKKLIVLGYDCGGYVVKNILFVHRLVNYVKRKNKENNNNRCLKCRKPFDYSYYINYLINLTNKTKDADLIRSFFIHCRKNIKNKLCHNCSY